MSRKYDEPEAGEWVYPTRRGYKAACCDCGLVHRVDFRIGKRGAGKTIELRVFRDNRATAAMRRGKEFRGQRLVKHD